MNKTTIDIRNFSKHKNLYTFAADADGKVKVTKKKFDENGAEAAPGELLTTPAHFDDLMIEQRMRVLQDRKAIAQQREVLAQKERELDALERSLATDAAAFKAELEKVLNPPAPKK